MIDIGRFQNELQRLDAELKKAKRVLITAPGTADGDSLGSQLSLHWMLKNRHPHCEVYIVNDEPLPDRYLFLPGINYVDTPETYARKKLSDKFDIALIVDGGIDRAGRVAPLFKQSPVTVFIDHHAVSVDYPYSIRIVESTASSTTELIYHISQTSHFSTPVTSEFSQLVYLGLIFDTGFFRHSNTTPEVLELAASLLRTGFDFTRVGERGMLERTFSSLKLLSDTLGRAELAAGGRIIWSTLSQKTMREYQSHDDDREGIIDHLFLTHGIEVAVLFFELADGKTKLSLRSQGLVDVARFARSLTQQGGGHLKAAGALLDMSLEASTRYTLERLEKEILALDHKAQARG